MTTIRSRFGPDGVTAFEEEYGGRGKVTDDTQMTLFTLEGLIRGHHAMRTGALANPLPAVTQAYVRWLYTQGPNPAITRDGWLVDVPELLAVRAPGMTCLGSLQRIEDGKRAATFTFRVNNSKGCGAVMRSAPFAIWSADLDQAVDVARAELSTWEGHEEQLAALDKAMALPRPTPESIADDLGGGWVGEEALAIAVLPAPAPTCGTRCCSRSTTPATPTPPARIAADAAQEFGPTPPDTDEWRVRYPARP